MKKLKGKHQYLLLQKNIFNSESSSNIALDDLPARIPIIRDNYADNINYGFHREDSENAYYHALYTFYAYDEVEGRRPYTRERLRKQMLQDFKNYIYCESSVKEDDKEARTDQLLRIMWHMEMFEEIIQVVLKNNQNFLNEFEESQQKDEDFFWIVALDQNRLFAEFGDEQIWKYQNLGLALRFYELTQLDWKYDELEWESNASGNKVISSLSYQAYRDLVNADTDTVTAFTEEFFESEKERECWKIYDEVCEELKNRPDCERITELTDRLLTLYPNESIDNLKENRMLGILFLVLEKRCLFWNLLCLAGESTDIIRDFEPTSMEKITRSEDEKFLSVKNFIRHSSKDENLFRQCLYILQIKKQVMDIADELRIEQLDCDIAYYTSLETFGYMLPTSGEDSEGVGRFSVMNIAYMNDPNEGKTFMQYLKRGNLFDKHYKKEELRKSIKYPYVFMKCFTSGIDDLPMWEMYGNHAEGCCIVLDRTCFWPEVFGRQIPVYRVCYIKKNASGYRINVNDNPKVDTKLIAGCIDQIRRLAVLVDKGEVREQILEELVGDIVYLFKDAAYQHEQEVRIFYRFNEVSDDFRHTPTEIPMLYVRPDIPVKIKEIILGPKCSNIEMKVPYLQERVEWMCKINGFKMPLLTKSAVEYK